MTNSTAMRQLSIRTTPPSLTKHMTKAATIHTQQEAIKMILSMVSRRSHLATKSRKAPLMIRVGLHEPLLEVDPETSDTGVMSTKALCGRRVAEGDPLDGSAAARL
jgi:hypothetical protein